MLLSRTFIVFTLTVLLLSSNLFIFTNLESITDRGDIPQEVKMYLREDEEVVEYLRVSHDMPVQNQVSPSKVFEFVFYEVIRDGKPTREYIVWDNVKKSVVGGFNWPLQYSISSYKTIISYLEHESIASLFSKYGGRISELKINLKNLNQYAEKLMEEIEKKKEMWTIILTTAVSIAVTVFTAGAALPAVIGILGVIVSSAWRFSQLDNLVIKWDAKPQKYPSYFTTASLLATFVDEKDTGKRSSQILDETLEKIKDLNPEVKNYLVNLNDASSKISQVGVEIGKDLGRGLAVDYLSKLTTFWTAASLHSIRGIIGNEKFYEIFGEKLTDKIEGIAFRLLGGEKELGINQKTFSGAVSKLGKFFAAKFRPSAVKGIPKEEILNSFRDYEDIMGKTFTRDSLLKGLKTSIIGVTAVLATEYLTKTVFDILNKDVKEVATNCFIHSQAVYVISETFLSLSKEVEDKDNIALRSYASLIQAQLYSTLIRENIEEMWDLLNATFTANEKLLGDGRIARYLGEWFKLQCEGAPKDKQAFIKCSEENIRGIYRFWSDFTNDYLALDEKISSLTDSYLKNMTERMANAIPRVRGKIDIVLTLDKSGSMKDEFLDKTKIGVLKDSASYLIQLFSVTKGDARVAVVSFSTTAEIEVDLTNDYRQVKEAIDRLTASGNTAMGDALRISLRLLEREADARANSTKAIILLTDGRSNVGVDPREVLNELVTARIPVFTIGIGRGLEEYDPKILEEIAKNTNAFFYEVDPSKGLDIYALQRIFLRIGLAIVGGGNVVGQKVVLISQNQIVREVIDASDGKSFAIVAQYGGSKVSVNLYDPRGEKIQPSREYLKISSPGFEAWIISDPDPGLWGIELVGEDIPSDSLTIFITEIKAALEIVPSQVIVNAMGPHDLTIKIMSNSNQIIRNVKLQLQGDISKIGRLESEEIDEILPYSTKEIMLRIDVPSTGGYYDGHLIIIEGWIRHYIPIKVFYDYLVVQPFAEKQKYELGETINIYAAVKGREGEVVNNAKVSLSLDLISCSLNDEGVGADKVAGDGIYSGTINVRLLPGVYSLNILAEKQGYVSGNAIILISIKKLPGDINSDGRVDYIDLGILGRTYGSRVGRPEYYLEADLNEDGIVDYKDLGILALNYGVEVKT